MFWNTNPELMIVGRTEDYVAASHPSFVAAPRGVQRWGTADQTKRSKAISWTVKYGNVAFYENNRFPNDGMNKAGLRLYARKGWSGDVIPHLVEIDADIYGQSIE